MKNTKTKQDTNISVIDFCKRDEAGWILNALTSDKSQRLVSFEKEIAGAMITFQNWVIENSLSARSLKYAILIRAEGGTPVERIASFQIEPDGVSIRMLPARGRNKALSTGHGIIGKLKRLFMRA